MQRGFEAELALAPLSKQVGIDVEEQLSLQEFQAVPRVFLIWDFDLGIRPEPGCSHDDFFPQCHRNSSALPVLMI
jgi:hypothetical protein